MRIKVMVLALAGVTAAWAVQAEEAEPIEQVVIAGDKLKRTETDSAPASARVTVARSLNPA
jgi:hypothetical protein